MFFGICPPSCTHNKTQKCSHVIMNVKCIVQITSQNHNAALDNTQDIKISTSG